MASELLVKGTVVTATSKDNGVRLSLKSGSQILDVLGRPSELGIGGATTLQSLKPGTFVECRCVASHGVLRCLELQAQCPLSAEGAFAPEQLDRLVRYSALLQSTRAWLAERGYVEVRLPSIHFGQNVAGSFLLDFQGEPARLSGANALFLNVMAMQLGRAFTLQRAFRLESEYSFRHLAEFDLLEAGGIGLRLPECMDLLEQLIRKVTQPGLQAQGLSDKLVSVPDAPFPRIPYEHLALRYGATDGLDKYERQIAADGPVFVVNPPSRHASWSAQRTADGRSCSFSLLLPGIGEVAEGAEESTDAKYLADKFRALGLERQLGWYARLQSYPMAPLGTVGLGVERLAMWSQEIQDIKDLNPFHRSHNFAEIPKEVQADTELARSCGA